MSDPLNAVERLRLIDEALSQALELTDAAGESLIGALLSEAQDAVLKRFKELAHH